MEYEIKVENVTKRFGNFVAVNDISFNIKKGEIFGFLGPNGSGKSTTIRMLCGVLHPTSGKGYVLGYDIVKETEKIRQILGYMSQKFGLYEDLTVKQNLDFYAGIYGLRKKEKARRIEEIIQMTKLSSKVNSSAGVLSGGWKQRLALGCAIVNRPKFLILDEPTAGVDPVSRRIFWGLIKQLADDGVTILVTTHYMDEAESCDIVGFIFNGNIINIGAPKDLIQKENADTLEDVFVKYVEENIHTGVNVDMSKVNP